MEHVSTRDLLQGLANEPLGCREFEGRPRDENGNVRPEIKEVAKRISKKWLPQGRKTGRRAKCNEPQAVQTDIEDAVEAAGGMRGGPALAAATGTAKTPTAAECEASQSGGEAVTPEGQRP